MNDEKETELAFARSRSNAGLGCCAKPVLTDWSKGELLNKRCSSCGGRWFGRGNNAKFFTRREWDAWIEEDEAERNKQFFRERARICENCIWCAEITNTEAFCSREETMAHGWNRRTSTCEEHSFRFKVPNAKVTGAAPTNGERSDDL